MAIGKKAQVANEFLATYGWAFALVVLVMATIAYIGLETPGALQPTLCVLSVTGVNCADVSAATNGTLTLLLQNVGDAPIALDGGTCVYVAGDVTVTTPLLPDEGVGTWPAGAFRTLRCSFEGDDPFAGKAGQKTEISGSLKLDGRTAAVQLRVPVRATR